MESCEDLEDPAAEETELEEPDPSQAFDSDSFMEMIVAYLPQLESVDVSAEIIVGR